MLSLPSTLRVFACRQPTDMHKSFDGLSGLVEQERATASIRAPVPVLQPTPRAAERYFVDDGLVIFYRCLEWSTFEMPRAAVPEGAETPAADIASVFGARPSGPKAGGGAMGRGIFVDRPGNRSKERNMARRSPYVRELEDWLDEIPPGDLEGEDFEFILSLLARCWTRLKGTGQPDADLTIEGLSQVERIGWDMDPYLEIEVPCWDRISANPTYRLVYIWQVDLRKGTKERLPGPIRRLARPESIASNRALIPASQSIHRRPMHLHR
jgi:hypothetical protein